MAMTVLDRLDVSRYGQGSPKTADQEFPLPRQARI